MHSTRMGQPQSVILEIDDKNDGCSECLLRDVRESAWGFINVADKAIEVLLFQMQLIDMSP